MLAGTGGFVSEGTQDCLDASVVAAGKYFLERHTHANFKSPYYVVVRRSLY